MSNFSSILDTYGRVYLESKRSPSEQLAWMKLHQSADMQALQGAVGNLEAEFVRNQDIHPLAGWRASAWGAETMRCMVRQEKYAGWARESKSKA